MNDFSTYTGGYRITDSLSEELDRLARGFSRIADKREFLGELEELMKNFSGRPTPLSFAENLSRKHGKKIYLKREDLNHTGSYRIDNAVGQALLAEKLGKRRIVTGTRTGSHGAVCAAAAARAGFSCTVFQREKDMQLHPGNVRKMKLLGASVIPVRRKDDSFTETLDAALEFYIENKENTYYLAGAGFRIHPYPSIMEKFLSMAGFETKKQIIRFEGCMPDCVISSGDSGAETGIFSAFSDDSGTRLVAVRAAGDGANQNRVESETADDTESAEALGYLARGEGIITSLESARALAWFLREKPTGKIIVINISERGDRELSF